MGDADLIHPTKSPESLYAVDFILQTVAASPDEIDLIVLGPATNIALAIQKDPGKQITVTVVHKDGSSKEFTYETNEQYLGTVLKEAGLIQGEDGPYGLMISTVDGELADWNVDQGYWALYVGEEYAVTGIDMTPITDGGSYSLEYTIG